MKWIDAKMEELGMISNPNFKICMVMDDLAMITVDTPTYGVIEAGQVVLYYF
jgi:ubiquitin-like domain-containing CTD phosphatase 1